MVFTFLNLLSFHLIYYYANDDMYIVLMQAGPDPQFYVKYRILESTCTTEENKLWQYCHYKASADAVSICSLYKFSEQKHQHNDQDCNCLGKNTVEELTFLAVLLLRAYMTTVQYRNVYNPKVNHYNPEFSITILNICRKENFSASI